MVMAQQECPVAPDISGDLFGFVADDLDEGITHFASGVLSPAIWEGYRRASAPVCVVASEMGTPAIERAIEYARAGGRILVDSGAFIWKDRPDQMPWDRVIRNYASLAQAATGKLNFVLPDVVGDQDGSLSALAVHGPAILDAIGDRHEALLPLQTGSHAPADFARMASELLTRVVDGVAIPSHAAAFPPRDLRMLADLPASIPRRVHFLGISRNSQGLRERMLFLKEAWQEAKVSCDACLHRAQVGKGKMITEVRRSALDDYWDEDLESWDDTEEDVQAGLELARQKFPGLDDEALAALMASEVGSFIDLELAHGRHLKNNGPRATADSIYHFAQS